jgi:glycine betaine/choline ABC-type transport system substrate-binding protein
MKKTMKKVAIFMITCTLLITAGCSTSAANDTVKIGHRNFTEQRIVGQLLAVYLESKGYKTDVSEYEGTRDIFNALQNGDINAYTEYTGTAYGAILNQSKALGKDETYDYVKTRFEEDYGITLLEPLGWNNTYMLSVRPETAEYFQLKSISDIIPIADEMVLGSDAEFANRKDGLIGLTETYAGLEFKSTKSMEQELTYPALIKGSVDIIASYSTDAIIETLGLVNLIDDKNFFPPYYVTPVLKMDFAEKNPAIVAALEELEDQWSEEEIKKYNFMVNQGLDPRSVAEQMLRDKGLIA